MFGNEKDAPKGCLTFEFPVDGEFEPCTHLDWRSGSLCGSTERLIQFVQSNSGKRLICANEHVQEVDGKTFLPHDEFGPDGLFPNVLPRALRPTESQIRKSRWSIPAESARRHDRATFCALCGANPFPYGSEDTDALWLWISEHDSEMLADIHSALRNVAGVEIKSWYAAIPAALRMRVIHRVNMSPLSVDHGIPRKIADQHWHSLSRACRRFLQRNFLFPLCRKCNLGKSSKLLDRDQIIKMYIETYYDGSEPAARADVARWTLLEEALNAVYLASKTA